MLRVVMHFRFSYTNIHSWYPPVNIKVDIKASGAGGIVNAFILKGPGTSGDEVW